VCCENYLAAAMTRDPERRTAGTTRAMKDEKDRSDKNGNMAFKVHKMAVIRALVLCFNNSIYSENIF